MKLLSSVLLLNVFKLALSADNACCAKEDADECTNMKYSDALGDQEQCKCGKTDQAKQCGWQHATCSDNQGDGQCNTWAEKIQEQMDDIKERNSVDPDSGENFNNIDKIRPQKLVKIGNPDYKGILYPDANPLIEDASDLEMGNFLFANINKGGDGSINVPPHVVEDLGTELLNVDTETKLAKFLTRSKKLGLIDRTWHLDIHRGTHLQYKVGSCDMFCYEGEKIRGELDDLLDFRNNNPGSKPGSNNLTEADMYVYVLTDGVRSGKLCRDREQKDKYSQHWEEQDDSKVRVALLTRDRIFGVMKLWVPFYKLQVIKEYTVLANDFTIVDSMKTEFTGNDDHPRDGEWKKIYKIKVKDMNDEHNTLGAITFKDAQKFTLQEFYDECHCTNTDNSVVDPVAGRK